MLRDRGLADQRCQNRVRVGSASRAAHRWRAELRLDESRRQRGVRATWPEILPPADPHIEEEAEHGPLGFLTQQSTDQPAKRRSAVTASAYGFEKPFDIA